ncbi:type IV/VI secretion system, DotU family domain protein, partial [Vibrio parahaemolyticus V-223/04]
GNH